MCLAVGAVFGSSLARAVVSTIIPHKSILSAGTASTFAEEYMDFKMQKADYGRRGQDAKTAL